MSTLPQAPAGLGVDAGWKLLGWVPGRDAGGAASVIWPGVTTLLTGLLTGLLTLLTRRLGWRFRDWRYIIGTYRTLDFAGPPNWVHRDHGGSESCRLLKAPTGVCFL